MFSDGIKASELIEILAKLVLLHGDRPCFSGGTDYPEGVSGAYYKEKGDGYHSDRCFVIG
jgi:hypothetical protein